MAILRLQGVDTTSGQQGITSINDGGLVPGWLNVGPATGATALGDFSAGDGTRSVVWDASTGKMQISGIAAASTAFEALGSVNGQLNGFWAQNSSSGTSAVTVLGTANNLGNAILFYARSSTSTFGANDTGISTVGPSAGQMVIETTTAQPIILATNSVGGVTAPRWQVSGSGHFLGAGASALYDIGSTTDAQQPRDIHINRALNVGDVTAVTAEGAFRFGSGNNKVERGNPASHFRVITESASNFGSLAGLQLQALCTTTPVAGFGTQIQFAAHDDANVLRTATILTSAWNDPATASYDGEFRFLMPRDANAVTTVGGGIAIMSATSFSFGQREDGTGGETYTITGRIGVGGVAGTSMLLKGGDGVTGNSPGGNVSIQGGVLDGSGVNGSVFVGTAVTAAITIGATAIDTTVRGGLIGGAATGTVNDGDFLFGDGTNSSLTYDSSARTLIFRDLTNTDATFRVGGGNGGAIEMVSTADGVGPLTEIRAVDSNTSGAEASGIIVRAAVHNGGGSFVGGSALMRGAPGEDVRGGSCSLAGGSVVGTGNAAGSFLDCGPGHSNQGGAGSHGGDGRWFGGSTDNSFRGGNITIQGGPSGSGTDGIITIGAINTSAVALGATTATVGITGAGITLAGGSSEIDLTTTGNLDMNVANFLMDASAGFSIDAATASNLSVQGGTLTLQTNSSGSINLVSAQNVNINSAASSSINIGLDAVVGNIFIGTGAANKSITMGNTNTGTSINLINGATGSTRVNSLPLPTVLAQITMISLISPGPTLLYTVPSSHSAKIISVVVSPTTATTASGDAIVSIGVGGSFDNIIAATTLTGLDATTESFMLETGGIFHTAAASAAINFDVNSIDSGSALTVTVELIGYLV